MIRIRYGAVKCNTTECCKPSFHVNIVVFIGILDQKVHKEIKRKFRVQQAFHCSVGLWVIVE